jgi:hypothetical protein
MCAAENSTCNITEMYERQIYDRPKCMISQMYDKPKCMINQMYDKPKPLNLKLNRGYKKTKTMELK